MKKNTEILLINSFAPRQRIASDAALENSLAIIRTYLENRDIRAEVIDEQRIFSVQKGVPGWCLWLLSLLVRFQMKVFSKGFNLLSAMLMLGSWPVHAFSLYCRRIYMNKIIDDIIRVIKNKNTPMVGIKVWYGDSFIWSTLLASRVKKECPEAVIIAGGPQVKVYGESVLEGNDFDLAIMGPGEEMLEKLLLLRRKVRSKNEFLEKVCSEISSSPMLKTGSFNGQAKTTIKIATPRYRKEDLEGKILFHTIVDGVGCTWNKCNFCSHTSFCTHYQVRPIDDIIHEMKALTQQGIAFFRFSSSETPVIHGRNIAQAILDNGLRINYSMFVRAGKMTTHTYEAYRLMIKSGLRAVFMGGETGHDIINTKVMNKGVSKKDIIDTIQCIKLAAADVGEQCRIGLSLIYPCPVIQGVTLEDVYDENISLIQQTLPDTVIINPPGVFPRTKWFENASDYGFKIGSDFVYDMMQYEYSIYKPAEFWKKLNFSLQGRDVPCLLKETGRLRKAVADMGIPTDISDEYLMMTEAIGYKSNLDLLNFKQGSLMDIMTGRASYTGNIARMINEQSKRLAKLNL